MKIIAKILISLLSFCLLAAGSLVVIYSLLAFFVELRIFQDFNKNYQAGPNLGSVLTHFFIYLLLLVFGVILVFRGSKLSRKLKRQDIDTNPFALKSLLYLLPIIIIIFWSYAKGVEANRRLFQMMKDEGYDLTTEDARQKTLEKIRREGGQ